MKSLFLGLGKVNHSISKNRRGLKRALVESETGLEISQAIDDEPWRVVDRMKGDFDSYDFTQELPADVFISPGIDPRRSFFKQVSNFEIRELDEFCSRFRGRVICITGTDGKSTFTLQLGEILKRVFTNQKIFVGGNIGTAMFDAFHEAYELAILEVSSFQCERLKKANPDVAILLNLAIDHLDRYDSIEDYFSAKWHLILQSKVAIYPSGVEIPSSLQASPCRYKNDAPILEILKSVVSYLAEVWGFEIRPNLFENLPTLPHRLELYHAPQGNKYFVNDSKATTVHAVRYGYERLRDQFAGIALILGGKFKGDDFRVLAGHLRASDRLLLCGEARNEIYSQVAGSPAPISVYLTLEDLLRSAIDELGPQQCLMLSPGCSSYDEFENFEERGNYFLSEVRKRFDLKRIS